MNPYGFGVCVCVCVCCVVCRPPPPQQPPRLMPQSSMTPPPPPRLVGLMGPKGSGKSTAAAHLVRLGWVELAFADPLKEVCKAAFDLSEEQVRAQEAKETVDERWGVTPRVLLQTVGTELFRHALPAACPELRLGGETLWVRLMRARLERLLKDPAGHRVVVSDVRFRDEVDLVGSMGGSVWRVVRPSLEAKSASGPVDMHASETTLKSLHSDGQLLNSGSKEAMFARLGSMVGSGSPAAPLPAV